MSRRSRGSPGPFAVFWCACPWPDLELVCDLFLDLVFGRVSTALMRRDRNKYVRPLLDASPSSATEFVVLLEKNTQTERSYSARLLGEEQHVPDDVLELLPSSSMVQRLSHNLKCIVM